MGAGHGGAVGYFIATVGKGGKHPHPRRQNIRFDPLAAIDRHRSCAAKERQIARRIERADREDFVIERNGVVE